MIELPVAKEFEMAVLGCCLLHGVVPPVRDDEWGFSGHAKLARIIRKVSDSGEPVTLVTVGDRIDGTGIGADYLAFLADQACSPEHLELFSKRIKETAASRKILGECMRLVSDKKAAGSQPSEIASRLQKAITDATNGTTNGRAATVGEVTKAVICDIEERRQRGGGLVGMSTGLADLDRLTGGLCPGDLVVVAARPGMGKTAFATQVAVHAASKDIPVQFFSLEMDREQVVTRMLCQRAGVDLKRTRTGAIGDSEHARLLHAGADISQLPIHIDDEPALTDQDIKLRATQMRPGLVIVDYLTLIRPSSKEDRRDLEVAAITRSMKFLAKDIQAPVVLLSQLNRKVEERTKKKPMMSDLRDSGSIEQDADLILFLYREAVYRRDAGPEAEIIVAKHRNGPTGVVRCYFNASTTTFAGLERRTDDGASRLAS